MKWITRISAAIFLLVVVSSCTKGLFFDGKKVQPVMIIDMGDMYSTYNMTNAEKEEVSRQLNNKALLDEIIRYSKETMWPDAVNTLDERLNSRVTMMKYRFYKVATLGNKTIVTIPQNKNKHMPPGFIPGGPMYMIFVTTAVVVKK